MLKEQKNNMLNFLKMNAAGNDFIIFDARNSKIELSDIYIQKLCNRTNIGCDQLAILKKSSRAQCFMEIYNQDGSPSAVCGNLTRCVAALIMEEEKSSAIVIETAAGLLNCWRHSNDKISGDNISVEMAVPIFEKNFSYQDLDFFCVNMGNPHAVIFVDYMPQDVDFFDIAPKVEIDPFFVKKTNVEFAKIISDKIIEVRVWERGAGETLACGSGACAVVAAAIKNKLIAGNKIITRFKGGDLTIEWSGNEKSPIIMTGGYKKVFAGVLDENFFKN